MNTSTPIPPVQWVKLRQKAPPWLSAVTSRRMDAPVVVQLIFVLGLMIPYTPELLLPVVPVVHVKVVLAEPVVVKLVVTKLDLLVIMPDLVHKLVQERIHHILESMVDLDMVVMDI